MPRGRSSTDETTLQMALVGYEMEKQKIDAKIREIRERLGGKQASASPPSKKASKRRPLSAAARKRIAAAQRRRWKEHRKAQAAKGA